MRQRDNERGRWGKQAEGQRKRQIEGDKDGKRVGAERQ